MQVKVNPGEILLETIHVTRHDEGVILLHVDCESKYFDIACYGSSSDGSNSISLCKNEYTLYTDESKEGYFTDTIISDVEWLDKSQMIASAARYSLIISITAFDFDNADCIWRTNKIPVEL